VPILSFVYVWLPDDGALSLSTSKAWQFEAGDSVNMALASTGVLGRVRNAMYADGCLRLQQSFSKAQIGSTCRVVFKCRFCPRRYAQRNDGEDPLRNTTNYASEENILAAAKYKGRDK
jgi:hypothetical protein